MAPKTYGTYQLQPVYIPQGAGASPLGTSVARSIDASGDVVFQSGSARTFTLGDFFDHWGVSFGASGIGQYAVRPGSSMMTMTVNGENNTEFGAYPVQNGDNIVITFYQ